MPALARIARAAEWTWGVLVLAWLAEAHGPLRRELRESNLVYGLLVLSLLLLVHGRRELRARLASGWPVLLPVLLAALSPAWSADPQESLRAAVRLEAATAFGLWLALRFDAREQHRLVALVLALVVAGSAIAALAFPDHGVMQRDHAGAWRGLFLHKNLLAANLALAVLACGLLALGDSRARGWAGAAALVALLQLPLARSVGGAFALGLAALPVGVVAWQQRSRRRGLALVVAGGLTALLAVLLIAHADTLLGWVGREATLSRRTDIWTGSLATLRAHPWLGHGFGAFWTSAPERIPLFHGLGFAPRHAHNGLVDLALGLGLAGLLVFLAVYARELARALRLALGRPEWLGLWPLALLAWWIASNCHESALVGGAGLGWVLFVALAATPPGGSRAEPL